MEANYDQFIGHYPNAIDSQDCNVLINYFEEMQKLRITRNRKEFENARSIFKDDSAIIVGNPLYQIKSETMLFTDADHAVPVIREQLLPCINDYINNYDILENFKMGTLYHKLQKTKVGGGYHIWHCEQDSGRFMNRILVYTIYLNDVAEGGETEFLYQSKRYPARKGDVCVFPAHFTHPHRGNPPLSGEKYIMTGWIEMLALPEPE